MPFYRGNKIKLVGRLAFIDISTKKYPRARAVVDRSDLPALMGNTRRCYATRVNPHKIYVTRSIGTIGREFMHRIILGITDPTTLVDHEDGDTFNNRRQNLRSAAPSSNRFNSKKNCNNTSGFRGVTFRNRATPWEASIGRRQNYRYLGKFSTRREAAMAYDRAARNISPLFAKTNFK